MSGPVLMLAIISDPIKVVSFIVKNGHFDGDMAMGCFVRG